MRTKALLAALIGIDFTLLVMQICGLSIGYHEAKIIYGDFSPLQGIITLFFTLFGQNDYTLRLPMIFLHLFSVMLLYAISKYYSARESDRLWIVLIYMLLPGVTSAAIVVDNAGLMITSLFLFTYTYQRFGSYAVALFPLLIWIDSAFAYLFLAVVFYGIYKKEYRVVLAGAASLGISVYHYGAEISGVPKSHFLDMLGVYSAIFSPIVFIYLFYVLYRRMIAKEWDLIWMIASSAFLISLFLSFRQKVLVQSFAPFLLLSLPLAAQTFFQTYRVRLKEFRRRYRILFYSAFGLLIINALAVFFNQWFYRFLSDPTRHFSYPMHVAKELSARLHEENIHCVNANDEKLQLRMKFYGIDQCEKTVLETKSSPTAEKVTISYKSAPVFITYVTKVNTK